MCSSLAFDHRPKVPGIRMPRIAANVAARHPPGNAGRLPRRTPTARVSATSGHTTELVGLDGDLGIDIIEGEHHDAFEYDLPAA